ncbi:MUM1 protein, partial [Ceuthmochares aereus]|nr:MUM1 protein [Ceuthmochares aereus]
SSLLDQKNNSSEVVEELNYRCSLKIALDILNQNGSAGPVPPLEEGANLPLPQENNTGSLLSTPLRRGRSLFNPKEKVEPETSKTKREQKNNPNLKTDAKKQNRKGSFVLEESAKARRSGTSPSKSSTRGLYEASNSGRQNYRTPESKSPPGQEKVKPRLMTKFKPGHKNSLKPTEGKSKRGRKFLRGAESPVSCRNDFPEDQAQSCAEEGSPLSILCKPDTLRRTNARRQPKRTSQNSSGQSALGGLGKCIRSKTKILAKQVDGSKRPAHLKQVNGEQETGAAVSSYGRRKCRNCSESSSGPSDHDLSRLSPLVDEEEEDEELPSILSHQEPQSIEEGILVWCKLRRYPYWPAVVKTVRRKQRKACVLFIEGNTNNKKKGFSVPLKKLKHFDCEEKQDLIERAKEAYRQEIEWCIRLISDYHIRVGCHSFTGSFLEYFAADISYPVRKEAYHSSAQMTFPNTAEEGVEESSSETSPQKPCKKLLPDRTRAARDKANKKIVEFIVKTKGAEEHLLSILKSRKQSRWLKEFLNSRQYVTCVETYLEDEEQLDLVVNYLKEVYSEIDTKNLHQIHGDGIKFISDVLLPEAIIYAISAVDDIDYKKAEEKYIKGPSVSKR